MDRETLEAYNRDAIMFASDWETQPPPIDMYDLMERYFEPGLTADVGCGSGRDTEWLNKNGYPVVGLDASEQLLIEARERHPNIEFRHAALPELRDVPNGTFVNVLCETVIMHLPTDEIAASVTRLLALLQPGGNLYLSWRVTENESRRDEHGRLYSAFDPELVMRRLSLEKVILNEKCISASPGKAIQRVVAKKISR